MHSTQRVHDLKSCTYLTRPCSHCLLIPRSQSLLDDKSANSNVEPGEAFGISPSWQASESSSVQRALPFVLPAIIHRIFFCTQDYIHLSPVFSVPVLCIVGRTTPNERSDKRCPTTHTQQVASGSGHHSRSHPAQSARLALFTVARECIPPAVPELAHTGRRIRRGSMAW